MLINDIERYIALRQSLGFKLETPARHLRAFGRHAMERGDTHIRIASAITWSAETSLTPGGRCRLLQEIGRLARFLGAEDPAHEIPQHHLLYQSRPRPAPYIYTPEELTRMLDTAGNLGRQKPSPFIRHVYVMFFGLLASTGLRVSEALNLRLEDLLPSGVLHIRQTKFNKSRLVPMHPSVIEALNTYLRIRQQVAGIDDHVFLSVGGKQMSYNMAKVAFHVIMRKAGIAQSRLRRPRIHDLRHTFATRVLEQCATRREAVARDFVALSTYLGHTDIRSTYWYLEATPDLMGDIAGAAEALIATEVS